MNGDGILDFNDFNYDDPSDDEEEDSKRSVSLLCFATIMRSKFST